MLDDTEYGGMHYMIEEMDADIQGELRSSYERFFSDLLRVRDKMTRHINRLQAEVVKLQIVIDEAEKDVDPPELTGVDDVTDEPKADAGAGS